MRAKSKSKSRSKSKSKSRSKSRSKCSNKIKSHSRKGHLRKSYYKINKNGKKIRVKGSYVDKSTINPKCSKKYKSKSTKRKGSKIKRSTKKSNILPKLSKDISLRKHGYSVHRSSRSRRLALSKASKEYNPLVVLKRLNLARNYQSTVYSKDIMNDDMNWMKNQYKKYKKKHGMN